MKFRLQNFKAFTLFEVLVSIALFTVIGVAIASTMHTMVKNTKKIKSKETTVMSGQIALDRLERDLQMAYNERVQRSPCFFKANNVGNGPDISFSFLDSEMKTLFETRTPGVLFVRYYVDKNENGTLDIFRATAPLHEGENIKNAEGTLIASGVTEFKIDYYDAQNDLWHEDWDTSSPQTIGAFPKAVRVQIKTVDPGLPKENWKEKALSLSTEFLILNESEVR